MSYKEYWVSDREFANVKDGLFAFNDGCAGTIREDARRNKIYISIAPPPKLVVAKKSGMTTLTEWLHESVKGNTLEIVKITDLAKTVLGLRDTGSREVFIVGNMHDLTFVLNGNEKRDL